MTPIAPVRPGRRRVLSTWLLLASIFGLLCSSSAALATPVRELPSSSSRVRLLSSLDPSSIPYLSKYSHQGFRPARAQSAPADDPLESRTRADRNPLAAVFRAWFTRFAGGLNLYSYVKNSPISYRDPLGLVGLHTDSDSFLPSGYGFDVNGDYYGNLTLFGPENAYNFNYPRIGADIVGTLLGAAAGGTGGTAAGASSLNPVVAIATGVEGARAGGVAGLATAELLAKALGAGPAYSKVPGGGKRYCEGSGPPDDPVRFHHAWAKYLGGLEQQLLEPLPQSVHDLYHSGVDKIFPRRGRGGLGGIEAFKRLSPAAQENVLRRVAEFTRQFDAQHETSLLDAMIREGFPHP